MHATGQVRLASMYAVIDTITGQRICLTPDLDRAEAAAVSEQHVLRDAWDARHLLWYVRPGNFADRFEPYLVELQRLVFGPRVDTIAREALVSLRQDR